MLARAPRGKIGAVRARQAAMEPRPVRRLVIALLLVVTTLVAGHGSIAAADHADGRDGLEWGDPPGRPQAAIPQGSQAGTKSGGWADVPAGHWAHAAIDNVAWTHRWMRDFGQRTFRPDSPETRKLLARAVVRAFAPAAKRDPGLRFSDLPRDSPFERYANVAVKRGWMLPFGHRFRPNGLVTPVVVHRALLFAIGLRRVVAGINRIHTTDGYVFEHGLTLGTRLLGNELGLRYNHDDESLDVGPGSKLNRAEVAWSLAQAYVVDTSETWRKTAVQPYAKLHLGPVPVRFRRVVEFGLRYVGYPYVYAGEWHRRSPPGYCCGFQARGGFDCSGLLWWVLRAPDSIYDNSSIRHYRGYVLRERSSRDMAAAIPAGRRLTYDRARAGDILFMDGDDDGTIDHTSLFLGWGWALDSGSQGVTIVRTADPESWYRTKFTWARRLVPA